MALKFKYAKKEEVPAEHAAFYVEREGAFVPDAEGVAGASKSRFTLAGRHNSLS